MTKLRSELARVTAHHSSIGNRHKYITRLENRLLGRLDTINRLRQLGWRQPSLNLLKHLRPILSLEPLDQLLLSSARKELAALNTLEISKMHNALKDNLPIVAIVSCKARINQGNEALKAFKPWADQGIAQPLLITGNPWLQDWTFNFCPRKQWLQLPCLDSYEFLPRKLLTLMWVLSLLQKPPMLLKIDDDAQPENPDSFVNLIQKIDTGHAVAAGFPIATKSALCLDRAWHIGKSAGSANMQPFDSLGTETWLSGGTGYLLNSKAVELLAEFALHSWGFTTSMLYEDVCISMLLQAGHSRFCWLRDASELGINSERKREIKSGHWQPPAEFAKMHQAN